MQTHTTQLASLFIAPGGSWVVKFTSEDRIKSYTKNVATIDAALHYALHQDLEKIRQAIFNTLWIDEKIVYLLNSTHRPSIGYHTAVQIIVNVHIQLSRNCIDHYHPTYKAAAALLTEFINQYSV